MKTLASLFILTALAFAQEQTTAAKVPSTPVITSADTSSDLGLLKAERDLWKAAANIWQASASKIFLESQTWQDMYWERDPKKNKDAVKDAEAKVKEVQEAYQKAHDAVVKACSNLAGLAWDDATGTCKTPEKAAAKGK